uniref:Transposase n=1 Tax=Candidatus Kentrum sp. FW TaxID=2126338 RepID=A0A450U426_9GAMM|nr:MAG: Transposase [Candidatus Kentron sp. FW]
MNIIEVFEKFPTQESCIEHIEKVRWNGTPVCPYCGSTKTHPSDGRHFCYNCKTSFSVTVGTIFHHTHLPLQKWFLAISLTLNAKKGLSALQLSRDIRVNKNTAWRIAMQIRKAMNQMDHMELFSGIVEMDETYVGGKPRKGRRYDNPDDKPKPGRGTKKTPVIGAVERNGKAGAKVVKKEKMKGKDLRAFVKGRVDTNNAHLMTDEYKGYIGMSKILPHSVIKHSEWYVDGDIHTNSIESFWAILKRGVFGQYHSVSGRHLQKYVDEFCYRYNQRKEDRELVFNMTIQRALGV